MLEDSVLYSSRILARLVSILLMSIPLLNLLADPQELDLRRERISLTVPFVFEKIALNLHLHITSVCLATFRQSTDEILPRIPFHIDEWQQEILPVHEERHVSRWSFRASRARYVTHQNGFVRSKY